MRENLKKAFDKVKCQPESGLAQHIYQEITLRGKRIVRLKLCFFSFIGVISLVGLVPILKILISDFIQSGFYEYISLVFSRTVLSSSWRELIYSIAESLPATSLILSFGIIFVFFLSLRFVLKQIIKGQPNYYYLKT